MIRNKPHINTAKFWLILLHDWSTLTIRNPLLVKIQLLIIYYFYCYFFLVDRERIIIIIFFFQNGTWYHLSVHAAPNFVVVPKDIVYVGIGDNIILNCQVKSITEVFAEKTNYSKLTAKLFKLPFELFYNFAVFLLLCCYNSFIVIKQSY